MSTQPSPAAFFDIATSLGSFGFSPTGRPERLEVYPYLAEVLDGLRRSGVRLGITARHEHGTAEELVEVLTASELDRYFEPWLLLLAEDGASDPLSLAVTEAGHSTTPARCLYVSEDRGERSTALQLGLRVAPHPRLAWEALQGATLRYVRLTVPAGAGGQDWRKWVRDLPVVPLHLAGEEGGTLYAIATSSAASDLDDLGFVVDRLGGENEPLDTEVYLLRDDSRTRTGFLVPEGASRRFFDRDGESRRLLASTDAGLYVALPAGRSVEDYHFQEARHGHTVKLLPDPGLLEPFGVARIAGWAAPPDAPEPVLAGEELEVIDGIAPEAIGADLARYAGGSPLDGSGEATISSRHIFSEDNAVATRALAEELAAIGEGAFSVRLHRFRHEGRHLENVEATLAGEEPEETVLVSAHLDSTASFSEGYVPERDPAPGADDDASGVVAVLAIARVLRQLSARQRPKRTIRLLLFNAEEHGLVGSKAYARDQAALEAAIVGVFQMDMIGYNRVPPPTFEVHAGFWPSADVEDRSLVLAERLVTVTEAVSPELPVPQLYRSEGPAPEQRDPAEGRSDHASFHLLGYAACAVSEDFFAGPGPGSQGGEPNPNYHLSSDTFVDTEYAAAIARAVAAAVWVTAKV